MPPDVTNPDVAVLHTRLDNVQREISQLSVVTNRVADSLAILVRLEEQHKATTREIEKLAEQLTAQNARVAEIEAALPGLKELRRIVMTGVFAGVAMLLVALVKLVLIDPVDIHRALQTLERMERSHQPLTLEKK